MICQGREFDFHKSLLTDISSVFKTSFGKAFLYHVNINNNKKFGHKLDYKFL